MLRITRHIIAVISLSLILTEATSVTVMAEWAGVSQCFIGGKWVTVKGDCPASGGETGGSYTPPYNYEKQRRWEERQIEQERKRQEAESVDRQARALYEEGRYEEALQLYLQAKSMWSSWGIDQYGNTMDQHILNCRSMINLQNANRAFDRSDYESAVRLVREAIDINPKNGHLWQDKLQLFESQAKTERAVRLTERAISLIDQGNYREAEALLTEAVRLDPNNSSAYGNLGRAIYYQKRYAESEAFYRQAILLYPAEPAWHTNLGLALQSQKRYAEAEAAYRQTVKLSPDDSKAHYFLGVVLSEQDNNVHAVESLQQAVRLNPKDHNAQFWLGKTLMLDNRLNDAKEALREAVRLAPNYGSAHLLLGYALEGQMDYPAAEAAFRSALKLMPSDVSVYNALGDALRRQQRYKEAEVLYRDASRVDPNDRDAQIGLGLLYYHQGRYTQAEAICRDLINKDTSAAKDYQVLSGLITNRKLIEQNPNDDRAHRQMGTLMESEDRYIEANAEYKKALQLNPSDDDTMGLIFRAAINQEKVVRSMLRSQYPNASTEEFNQMAAAKLKEMYESYQSENNTADKPSTSAKAKEIGNIKAAEEARANVSATSLGNAGSVFDTKGVGVPARQQSTPVIAGSNTDMSERAKNDPRMIGAQKEMDAIQSKLQDLDAQRTQLSKERNIATDSVTMEAISQKIDKVEKSYQTSLMDKYQQKEKMEKLKRTIDTEVEQKPQDEEVNKKNINKKSE